MLINMFLSSALGGSFQTVKFQLLYPPFHPYIQLVLRAGEFPLGSAFGNRPSPGSLCAFAVE